MAASSSKKKLLVFWSSTDFKAVYESTFARHPGYELELVSGFARPEDTAGYRRLLHLRRQVDEGKFDLVLANNVMRSPFPGNKGIATTASLALRLFTINRRRLDTWWAPWIVRGGRSRTPLAVIDARDSHFIFPWDFRLLQSCRLYFKRDLMSWPMRAVQPLEIYHTKKVTEPLIPKLRPMSLGLEEKYFAPSARPMRERDIDVFMSGGDNLLRRLVREKCEKLSSRFKVFVNTGLLPFSEYLEMIQRSKLAVCVESWGGETWRQYEVAAAGAVPLISWPYSTVHEPLEPDRHAVYFSYIGDHFERQVESALSDLDRLQKISDEARAFTLARKGRMHLLDYVVESTLAAG